MADGPPPSNTSSEGASQLPGPGPPRGVQESRQVPYPRPHDIGLHSLVHTAPAEEDEEIDLHPVTSVLVPSNVTYEPPPPHRGPNHTLQGLPLGSPGLTLEEMAPRFKSRVPLRLATNNDN